MRASPVLVTGIAWIAWTGCAVSSSPQASVTAEGRAAPAAPAEPGAAQVAAPAGLSPLPFRLPCEETDLIGCTNGCADHQVEDCVTLGSLYLRGDIVSIDAERAAKLFREACDENSARGCLRLGDVYHSGLQQGTPEDETSAYRRACEAGANQGCLEAGRAYLDGRGVGADPVFAAQLFRRVCERGNAPACVELAHLHTRGQGVQRDPLKATELYTKACKLGFDEGCLLASRTGDVLPPRE